MVVEDCLSNFLKVTQLMSNWAQVYMLKKIKCPLLRLSHMAASINYMLMMGPEIECKAQRWMKFQDPVSEKLMTYIPT